MSSEVVQCVPNFSEGRDPRVVNGIAAAIRSVPGVTVLGVESDPDHNRSVITFVGDRLSAAEGALAGARAAVAGIDMTRHSGGHPRIGAVDVIPFVPVRGVTMKDCAAVAREVGERIGTELGVPVLLYGEAATASHRRELPALRRGEFEGLTARLMDPDWAPDFGPTAPHPTAGATAVGARPPLVAFNVNLRSDDLRVARAIARSVRARDGGLATVRAIGLPLADRGMTQVSMNLLDCERTPIPVVFEFVRREAERYGVAVASAEIVGLVPMTFLLDAARYYLRLDGFAENQVLEWHLGERQ